MTTGSILEKIKQKKLQILYDEEIAAYLFCNNVFIKFHDIGSVKGFTYQNFGKYYIVINESLSDEQKLKTFVHELSHIELKHFCMFNEEFDNAEQIIKNLGL